MLFEPNRTAYDLNFRIFGVDVRIHPLFWLISAFFTLRIIFSLPVDPATGGVGCPVGLAGVPGGAAAPGPGGDPGALGAGPLAGGPLVVSSSCF